jgi:uncharacterized hydrophobic protein (TIGR00271 family)
LSVAIATYGVIGDSVATVIGAMIIAPLMRPIMATAAGLVMGDFKRAGTSLLIVFVSVLGVIGLAWLLAESSILGVVSMEDNSQFANRVEPRLIDLYAALWSGAAAAFAMSRKDDSDALPGAAIAIALVPPLCVVGIGLAEGLWTPAAGALLLFLTNLLSILLAGGGVLTLLGLNAAAVKDLQPHARRNAFLVVVIGIALIAFPLGTTTLNVYQQKLIEVETLRLAKEWVNQTGFKVDHVDVEGEQVDLVIYGSGNRPQLTVLGERLDASLTRPVNINTINLIVLPSEQERWIDTFDE